MASKRKESTYTPPRNSGEISEIHLLPGAMMAPAFYKNQERTALARKESNQKTKSNNKAAFTAYSGATLGMGVGSVIAGAGMVLTFSVWGIGIGAALIVGGFGFAALGAKALELAV